MTLLSQVLRKTGRAYTASPRARLGLAGVALLASIGSLATLLQPPSLLPATLAVLAVLVAGVAGLETLTGSLAVAALLATAYTVLGVLAQYILGFFDPLHLIVNSIRMTCFTLLSTLVASLASPAKLVKGAGRYSQSLALGIALTLRLAYTLSENLARLDEVYTVNLGQKLKGFRRIEYLALLARTLTVSSTHTLVQVMEALYTRTPTITRQNPASHDAGRSAQNPTAGRESVREELNRV